MSGGVGKIIQELEKDFVEFVEEEVHELEEGVEEKSVYSDKFKGDILGKHDPYGEDSGDHAVHASESSVPEPGHDAEWFPAVKGTASRKSGDRKADKETQDEHRKETAADRGGEAHKKQSSDAEKDASTAASVDGPSEKGAAKRAEAARRSGETHPSTESASKQANKSGEGQTVSAATQEDQGERDGETGSFESSAAEDERTEDPDKNMDQGAFEAEEGGIDADAEDSPQAAENRALHRKSASMVADLDALSEQGKQAKEKKEILRGVRRTLAKPHTLYKHPERLAAVRSGDEHKLMLSLKRHGRTIEPVDDPDPHDISNDPEKLQAIRKNHRLAMRHVLDLGNQYGMDPLDGLDPEDVQAVIEHHAAHHPHRKHQRPYRSAKPEPQAEPRDGERHRHHHTPSQQHHHAHHKHHGKNPDLDDNDRQWEGHDDGIPMDEEDQAAAYYPRLEESADVHSSVSRHRSGAHHPKKRKRPYPAPYSDDQQPNDLQLAADSLTEIGRDAGDQDEDSFDVIPPHKRKAHAAKRMLKCVNRIRSFQQDPAAYEGAFVDEAEESGARVNGMSPTEVEDSYYALKSVSPEHHKKKKKHKRHHHSEEPYGDPYNEDQRLDDGQDGYNPYTEKHSSKHKHRHPEEGYEGMEGDHQDGYDPYTEKHSSKHKQRRSEEGYEGGEGNYADENQGDTAGEEYTQPGDGDYESYEGSLASQENYQEGESEGEIPDIETYDSEGAGYDYMDPSQMDPSQMTPEMMAAYGIDPSQIDPSQMTPEMMAAYEIDPSQIDPSQMTPEMMAAYGIDPSQMDGDDAGENMDPTLMLLSAATGLFGGGSEEGAGQAAGLLEGAVSSISEVEGSLSKVESLGAKAKSASSKIKGMKNARANFSKMVNLCSNPIDSLTEGDNVLAGVAQLAMHPKDALDQAKSLINVGKQGIAALSAAKSPADALGAVMGIAMQMQGGGEDDMDMGMDPSQMTPEMMAAYGIDPSQMDPNIVGSGDPEGYVDEEYEEGAVPPEMSPDGYPEAFANDEAYGGEEYEEEIDYDEG